MITNDINDGHDDGEDGHGLRRAVDGHPPLLTEQQQHGGNQRASVADADPDAEGEAAPAPAEADVFGID